MRVGVDTGGTFTDLVADDGRIVKVPSTPTIPASVAVRGRSRRSAPRRPTCSRTARRWPPTPLLERAFGRVALVTDRGFADVIEIARQARPSLYDPTSTGRHRSCDRELRVRGDGAARRGRSRARAFRSAVLPTSIPRVDAVAVCLLHADLDPTHERRGRRGALGAWARRDAAPPQVSPEFREYERMVTTVANAALRPVCRGVPPRARTTWRAKPLVMTSAGGLVPGRPTPPICRWRCCCRGRPVACAPRPTVAAACGFPMAVSFDMGGTSTDVCLVRGGVPEPSPARVVAGYPIRMPSLDVHTIGAGGGSIARLDAGGALVVGPESAGADPGPACYGRGGTQPTVTDADLVLGRIGADTAFAGLDRLDVAAAPRALDAAGVSADGRRRGRRRGDGAGGARGDGRAGRRPARDRARRVRRRRSAARVRRGRRARRARP